MLSLKDIGQLIQVPIEQVQVSDESQGSGFQIAALSSILQEPDLRNWIPVIVQEPEPRQYQAISNEHILLAMEAAGQEYVWVAVVPEDASAEEQVKLLTGQIPLTINICSAEYDMIFAALQHLRGKLGKLDIALVADRIYQAAGRRGWSSLTPLTKLKCGLTKSKLQVLSEVFDAAPLPIEINPIILNTASEAELLEAFETAACLPQCKLVDVNLTKLASAIFSSKERLYWHDYKPLTKLKCGLTPSKLKGLDQILHLKPCAPPYLNNVRYLLEQMKVSDLKKEAIQREITVPKGIKKAELVDLLTA
ncbi:hypothetical protein [Acaryochloris marina]|uniref:SAP domain-containing protein n=1 Tax=Acaryochloris marina (strain MBIC 11017) TaxID=329726 RepID=A8ZQY5_ACAM1|nr:hypothetical protein [Acaryochloris marina]ABW33421.1 hypothetical protein AM1_H0071 [Acaryochloris marina MBIC11017]